MTEQECRAAAALLRARANAEKVDLEGAWADIEFSLPDVSAEHAIRDPIGMARTLLAELKEKIAVRLAELGIEAAT